MPYSLYSLALILAVLCLGLTPPGGVYSVLVVNNPVALYVSWLADGYTTSFASAVGLIASSIFLYSNWYMSGEVHTLRFSSLVLVFVGSMLVLITASTPFTLILGWDGLGVSSYFLVVYYENYKASGAGTTTLLSNRVGDVFVVLFFIMMASASMNLPYSYSILQTSLPSLLGVMVLLAAITKSAMYPYSTWLPEAMAAPTPVSSLVHSSTLVTAGVYMLIRFSPALGPLSCVLLGILASFTLLVASMFVMLCMDFKKIIALSTLSQLCFMMIPIAMCAHSVAMAHLVSHAFFKSALFMSAGAVIHLSASSQEGRSAPTPRSPLLTASVVTCASLAGVAPLSGFMSKEYVLYTTCVDSHYTLLVCLLTLGCFMSVLYSSRLLGFFLYPARITSMSTHSSAVGMAYSSLVLILLSVVVGQVLITLYSEQGLGLPPAVSLMVKLMFGWAITLSAIYTLQAPEWYNMQSSFSGLGSTTVSVLPRRTLSMAVVALTQVDKGLLERLIPMKASLALRSSTPMLYLLASSPMASMLFSAFTCILLCLCIYA